MIIYQWCNSSILLTCWSHLRCLCPFSVAICFPLQLYFVGLNDDPLVESTWKSYVYINNRDKVFFFQFLLGFQGGLKSQDLDNACNVIRRWFSGMIDFKNLYRKIGKVLYLFDKWSELKNQELPANVFEIVTRKYFWNIYLRTNVILSWQYAWILRSTSIICRWPFWLHTFPKFRWCLFPWLEPLKVVA